MHEPVMVLEVLEHLKPRPDGIYIDGTVGSGGHAAAILERMGEGGMLLGIDADRQALERARRRLAPWAGRVVLEQGNFAGIEAMVRRLDLGRVDGVLLDFGVSLEQLEEASRGFSFRREGPLDMRMDQEQPLTAAELVARESESALAGILRQYGEERMARRIAAAVVRERARRPLASTAALAGLVARVAGGARSRIHPATRTFQALRIAVNSELDRIAEGIEAAIQVLGGGGRLVVIAYHSLEDRLVKQGCARHVGRWESDPRGGRVWQEELPGVRWVTRKPLMASDEEVARNPMARSGKLRCVERIP